MLCLQGVYCCARVCRDRWLEVVERSKAVAEGGELALQAMARVRTLPPPPLTASHPTPSTLLTLKWGLGFGFWGCGIGVWVGVSASSPPVSVIRKLPRKVLHSRGGWRPSQKWLHITRNPPASSRWQRPARGGCRCIHPT